MKSQTQTVYIETDNESLVAAALSELIEFKICVEQDMLQAFGSRTRLAAMSITFSLEDAPQADQYLTQWLYEKLQQPGQRTIAINGCELDPRRAAHPAIMQALREEYRVADRAGD